VEKGGEERGEITLKPSLSPSPRRKLFDIPGPKSQGKKGRKGKKKEERYMLLFTSVSFGGCSSVSNRRGKKRRRQVSIILGPGLSTAWRGGGGGGGEEKGKKTE